MQLTGFGEFAEFGEFVEDFNPVFQPLDIFTENLRPTTSPVFALGLNNFVPTLTTYRTAVNAFAPVRFGL